MHPENIITPFVSKNNKKLLKESKIEKLPQNYSQLYALSETAIKNSKAYITMPTINENDTFLKILNKYDLADENNINSDKAINLLNQYKDLYNNGFIPKESLTQTEKLLKNTCQVKLYFITAELIF